MDEQTQPQEAVITEQAQPADAPVEQPVVAPKDEAATPEQAFQAKYQALVDETGYTFTIIPNWVQKETGDFTLKIETHITPKK